VTAGQPRHGGSPRQARRALSKVPQRITAFFWITKVLTTAQGEATSDYLVRRINPEIAVVLGAIGLAVALALQLRASRYRAWSYWLAVVMVAVFGTMAADVLHIGLHIPYLISTAIFLVTLTVIFAAWYASEKTLSIHSICTRRREWFYWATVLATFALGTAAGDLTAITAGLGYLGSGLMFAAIIAIPALAYWRLGLNSVAAFWSAYIVTRPLGASFADWLAVPAGRGGLDLGRGQVSLALTIVIIGFVGYLAVTRLDVSERFPAHSARHPRHRQQPARRAGQEQRHQEPGGRGAWPGSQGAWPGRRGAWPGSQDARPDGRDAWSGGQAAPAPPRAADLPRPGRSAARAARGQVAGSRRPGQAPTGGRPDR
jgi:uncharacterized membrane-anchored protein